MDEQDFIKQLEKTSYCDGKKGCKVYRERRKEKR